MRQPNSREAAKGLRNRCVIVSFFYRFMPSRGRESLFLSFSSLPGVGNIHFQKKLLFPRLGTLVFKKNRRSWGREPSFLSNSAVPKVGKAYFWVSLLLHGWGVGSPAKIRLFRRFKLSELINSCFLPNIRYCEVHFLALLLQPKTVLI